MLSPELPPGPYNQRDIESRPDVLSYTSARWTPYAVSEPCRVTLFVASSGGGHRFRRQPRRRPPRRARLRGRGASSEPPLGTVSRTARRVRCRRSSRGRPTDCAWTSGHRDHLPSRPPHPRRRHLQLPSPAGSATPTPSATPWTRDVRIARQQVLPRSGAAESAPPHGLLADGRHGDPMDASVPGGRGGAELRQCGAQPAHRAARREPAGGPVGEKPRGHLVPTTRSVNLTPAGQAFLEPCRAALDAADGAARAAQNSACRERSAGSGWGSPAPSPTKVYRCSAHDAADYPLLNLYIASSANSETVLSELIGHKLNISMVSTSYHHPRIGRGLVAADRLGVFVPSNHPLGRQGGRLPSRNCVRRRSS